MRNKLRFIITTRHQIGRVYRFVDYSEFHPDICDYSVIETNRQTFVCPRNYVGNEIINPYQIALPDSYFCKLTNGCVIGESSVVVSEKGAILYDMLSDRKRYGANMTDYGLCLIGGKPRHFGEYFIYNYLKGNVCELEKGISLVCNMSYNYYHFMFEVASKFFLLSKIVVPKEVPLLVDEQVMNTPQMCEIVEALNVERRQIILIKKYTMSFVRELYVLSKPHTITPNVMRGHDYLTEGFAFDQNALFFVRDSLIAKFSGGICKGNKIVFLSRRNCNKRKCNEDDLQIILRKYHADTIYTDNMTVEDQIREFYGARLIVGSSGAAFTNLLFAQSGSTALIFTPSRVNVTCFSSLASAIGINTIFMTDKKKYNSIHTESYHIEPSELEYVLDNIINS